MTETNRYDRLSIILHWTIGIGILLLAGMELIRGEFPRGHFLREGLKAVHQPLGIVLFALILVRVGWRFAGATVPRASGKSLMDLAGHIAHIALYALMVLLPILGMIYVFGNDRVVDFGLFKLSLPLKASLGGIAKPAREVHEALGVTILVVAGLHAAAALFHHHVLRDGVLRRMMPGSPAPKA